MGASGTLYSSVGSCFLHGTQSSPPLRTCPPPRKAHLSASTVRALKGSWLMYAAPMARSHRLASAAGMRSGLRARRTSRRRNSESLDHSPAGGSAVQLVKACSVGYVSSLEANARRQVNETRDPCWWTLVVLCACRAGTCASALQSPPGMGVLSGASLPAQRSQSSQFFSRSFGSPANAGSWASGTSAAHCASPIQRASSSLMGGAEVAWGQRTCRGGRASRGGVVGA